MATQELTFKISVSAAAATAELRRLQQQTATAVTDSQKRIGQGELTMSQQLAASAALQRQRSAALVAAWKAQERAAHQAASGSKSFKDVMEGLTTTISTMQGPLGGVAGRFSSLTSLTTGLTGSVGALTIALGAGVAVIAAAAVGAVALGNAFFEATKKTAAFQGKFFDLSQQVGVSVETLSTLDIVASTTGGNIDTVSAAMALFQRNLESAIDPTSKEAETLKLLGVTATDTETALRQTLKGLFALGEGTKQTDKVMELFGRAGRFVNAILKDSHGNLDVATEKFAALGLIVSTEAAIAADMFNDQLEILGRQVAAVAHEITSNAIPAFTVFFNDISSFLQRNRSDWTSWGEVVQVQTAGVLASIETLIQYIASQGRISIEILFETNMNAILGQARQAAFANDVIAVGERALRAAQAAGAARPRGGGGGGRRGGGGGAKTDAGASLLDNLGKELFRLTEHTKKEEVAQQLLEKQYAKTNVKVKEQILAAAELIDKKKALNEAEKFTAQQNEVIEQFLKDQNKAIRELSESLNTNLGQVQAQIGEWERLGVVLDDSVSFWLQFNATILDSNIALERMAKLLDDVKDSLPGQDFKVPTLTDEAAAAQAGAAGTAAAGIALPPPEGADLWMDVLDSIEERMLSFSDVVHNTLISSFHSIVSALGEGVAAWAIYGESLGKALRKALAAQLAQIAAEAAIQAALHAAYAIGKAAFGDFAGATKHAIAAVKFVAVAVAAGVGARVVAGNTFKQGDTGGGGGGAGGGAASQAPSKPQDRNVDRRSFMTPPVIQIEFKGDAADIIEAKIIDRYQNNGRIRNVIQSDGKG